MNHQFLLLFVFINGYVLLLILCEFLNRRRNIASENTRKLAHFVSSMSVLLFPHVFQDDVYVLTICAISFVMLLVSNKMNMLHSIDEVGRKTGGSYLLALSVGIIYYISVKQGNSILFTLPILILAICDPLAGIVGKCFNSKHILNGKSMAGSLTFLFSSLCISLFYLSTAHYKLEFTLSLVIAFTASITELLSPRGTDNVTIPLVVAGVLILCG